jgi:hypothetical protein
MITPLMPIDSVAFIVFCFNESKVNKKKAIPSDVSNLMKSITHDIFEIDIIIVSQLTRVFEETHTVTE